MSQLRCVALGALFAVAVSCQLERPGVSPTPSDALDAGDGLGDGKILRAKPTAGITIDGDLSDWSGAIWLALRPPDDYVIVQGSNTNTGDLSVTFSALWDSDTLYFAFEVTDQTHINTHADENIWQADSVQVGLDMARNGGSPYDDTDDFEYGWASTINGPRSWRWFIANASNGSPAPEMFGFSRSASVSSYEIALTRQELMQARFAPEQRFGFSTMINDDDNDGVGRAGFVQWTPGMGTSAETKNPGEFGTLALIE